MVFDYSTVKMCRACESPQNLVSLASDANRSLLKKLRACVDVSIEINDALPNHICSGCVGKLDASYRFKIRCEYTDQKLRDLIAENTKQGPTVVDVHPVSISPAITSTCLDDENIELQDHNFEEESEVVSIRVFPDDDQGDEELLLDPEVICKPEDNNEDHLIEEDLYEEDDIAETIIQHDPNEYVKDDISIIYAPVDDSIDNYETSLGSVNESPIEMEYTKQDEEEEADEDTFHELDEEDDGEILSESVEPSQKADSDEDYVLEEEEEEQISPKKIRSSFKSATTPAKCDSDGRKIFECVVCQKNFTNVSELRLHRKSHGKKQFQCEICQRWFFKRYHLKNHENVHRGLKPFDCTLCQKKYTNQGNLDRHIRVFHDQVKGHVCDICGKSFSQSTILRQHYSVHMEDRNFECDICHKRYKTQDYLNLHKNRHLPIELRSTRPAKSKKPVKKKICFCTFCGKKTNSVALHQSHMRTHTGEKPYECLVCNKKFSFQQSLRCHALLHTGEKPFECTECGMAFRQIGHLKGHQLTHTGQKEHECSICFKTFAQRGNLTVHMRLHTGETPYGCQYCPKRFYDSNGLKRHTLVHVRKWDPLKSDDGGESAEAITGSEAVGREEVEIETLDEVYAQSDLDAIEKENNDLMDMYISEDEVEYD